MDITNSIDSSNNIIILDTIKSDNNVEIENFSIENINRKQSGSFWDGPALISVAKDGGMDDFCKLICIDPLANENNPTEEASYRCASNSAVAYLRLGEFMS